MRDLGLRICDRLSHQCVGVFRLRLASIEVSLDVPWQISVSGVVNILGWEIVVWLVELVELLVSIMDIILDTIAVFVVNFLSISVSSSFPLLASEVLQLKGHIKEVLRTADVALELSQLFLIGHLDCLEEHQLLIVKLSASNPEECTNCKFHFI